MLGAQRHEKYAGVGIAEGIKHVHPHRHVSQAREVAPPIRAHPPQTLSQVLRVALECRLHLAFAVILDLNLPVVVEEPSCDKVVVVGVEEVVATPCLVCEAIGELRVLQDL